MRRLLTAAAGLALLAASLGGVATASAHEVEGESGRCAYLHEIIHSGQPWYKLYYARIGYIVLGCDEE